MKKIDKSAQLSSKYFQQLSQWEDSGKAHPPYKSDHRFYEDVLMNLLHCQDGLCAYTEMILTNPDLLNHNLWEDGSYHGRNGKQSVAADIEHFDPDLKPNKGWLWENLFAVDPTINRKVKGIQKPDDILKPDEQKYDPHKYLYYVPDPLIGDTESTEMSHIYVPNPELPDAVKVRVQKMIKILGLNHSMVVARREEKLRYMIEYVQNGFKTFDQISSETKEFPTAIEFIKKKMKV
ncbi:MAG: hypothetical protein AAFP89_00685 [Bacteroidota bacterium]